MHIWTETETVLFTGQTMMILLIAIGCDTPKTIICTPPDFPSTHLHLLTFLRRIKQLMKQLLFRLNQQQYRNTKYKKKVHAGLDDAHRHGRSPASPIDIDADEMGFDNQVETTTDPLSTYSSHIILSKSV